MLQALVADLGDEDLPILELLSRGETEDGIAAALRATGEDAERRVHRVNFAVLALVSATTSQPDMCGAKGAPERTVRALLQVVRSDYETLMAVYGEAPGCSGAAGPLEEP
ncbi:hypothetical protein DEJ35_05425 [Curtobacterium sp. MCPF17_051]|nr:hypothetical protein DEJ35_05425 [Curtobacterium sp. MCPF17_051]